MWFAENMHCLIGQLIPRGEIDNYLEYLNIVSHFWEYFNL
jgi:hypothetical protein